MTEIVALNRTLDQELLALMRGASLECPVCGEFVMHADGAVFVDGLVTLVGGLLVVLVRPEVKWLGCAALPEACVAATDPTALAFEQEPALAGVGAPTERA